VALERAGFLTQMVEVLTSTVSFGERLNNMVHLLARNLKVDLALYFGLDKARETLLLNVRSPGPLPTPLPAAERQGVHLTCLMLAAALRQAIVQEEAKKRIAELSVLFEVGKALSSTMELDELLERIVSTTAKVITARGAALHIMDAVSGEPLVSSRYGQIPPECPALPKMAPGAGGAVEPPHFQGQSPDAKGRMHYCLAVPLTFKGQLQGTLGVYDKFTPSGEFVPFDPDNRQLLYTMAGVIVNASEHALTYQQVEDWAERNES